MSLIEGMCEVLLSSLPQMTAVDAIYRELGFVRPPNLITALNRTSTSELSASTCDARVPTF